MSSNLLGFKITFAQAEAISTLAAAGWSFAGVTPATQAVLSDMAGEVRKKWMAHNRQREREKAKAKK